MVAGLGSDHYIVAGRRRASYSSAAVLPIGPRGGGNREHPPREQAAARRWPRRREEDPADPVDPGRAWSRPTRRSHRSRTSAAQEDSKLDERVDADGGEVRHPERLSSRSSRNARSASCAVELERAPVGVHGVLAAPQPAQQVGPGRVEVVVVAQALHARRSTRGRVPGLRPWRPQRRGSGPRPARPPQRRGARRAARSPASRSPRVSRPGRAPPRSPPVGRRCPAV